MRGIEPGGEHAGAGIVAVIPAFNEERFIGSVVLKTKQYVDTVIVVDDGSQDGTAEIAQAAGATVVRHERNQGKGAALNTGLRRAGELDPAVVVLIDGDGQHRAGEIPALLRPILAGQADVVVGSRYLNGLNGVPRHRAWGHRAFTALTNWASGTRASDSQSGFRALSPQALRAIAFSSNGFSVESEMQFLAHEHGLRIAEAPITALYPDRPKRNVVRHGLLVLSGVLRLVGQYRPLLFFSGGGALLIFTGLALGAYVVYLFQIRGALAVGHALAVVALLLTGVFALFTGIILHSVRVLLLEIVPPKGK